MSYSVGQKYGGGVIFYVDETGQHGLIAATVDFNNDMSWNSDEMPVNTNAVGTAIGTGRNNTKLILQALHSSIISAAWVCQQSDYNGFSDWFLPSLDELNLIYKLKAVIGNDGFITDGWYWTSSQDNQDNSGSLAWQQEFTSGSQALNQVNYTANVRGIRAF